MYNAQHPRHLLVTAGLAILVGCQAAPTVSKEMAPTVVVPDDIAAQHDTVLAYLLDRYDANADSRVALVEYDRDGGQFERLDQNSDGYIDQADFASEAGGGEMRCIRRAQMVVMGHFDSDGDEDALSREEMMISFVNMDTSKDGQLDRAELETAIEAEPVEAGEASMMTRMMAKMDPFELLAAGVDDDGNDLVSDEELLAFFNSLDDGDGVWSFRGSSSSNSESSGPTKKTGAQVGTVAPNFTLASPHGGEPVSLASFAGKKPVALIFGSYT